MIHRNDPGIFCRTPHTTFPCLLLVVVESNMSVGFRQFLISLVPMLGLGHQTDGILHQLSNRHLDSVDCTLSSLFPGYVLAHKLLALHLYAFGAPLLHHELLMSHLSAHYEIRDHRHCHDHTE